MKNFLFSTLIAMVFATTQAEPVSLHEAAMKAEAFWCRESGKTTRSGGLTLALTETKTSQTRSAEAAFYVFSAGDDGFVIVAADDRAPDILGYSTTSAFDPDHIPVNVRSWLDEYVAQLSDDESRQLSERKSERAAIEPLVTTKWEQGAPYNDQCPKIKDPLSGVTKNAVTGCVATALAQVMSVWKFPNTLPACGEYTSGNSTFPAIDSHYINWNAMKDVYSNNDHDDNVAWLMRHCGQEVHMSYGPYESGAGTDLTTNALLSFGYDNSMRSIYRSYYRSETWDDMIYAELAGGRPVLYSGYNTNGSHAFVCDGYSRDGLFHINWGWGGLLDGYFRLAALDPGEQGVGGSTAGYTGGQLAVIGIAHGQNGETPVFMLASDEKLNDNIYSFVIFNGCKEKASFESSLGFIGDDGSITPIDNLIRTSTDLLEGSGFYVSIDLSADLPLTGNGTFRVAPVYRVLGSEEWKTANRENRFVYIRRYGSDFTAAFNTGFVPKASFSEITGQKSVGYIMLVKFALTNIGEDDMGRVYVASVAPGNTDFSYVASFNAILSPGETKTYEAFFTPRVAGKHRLCLLSENQEVLDEREIEIQGSNGVVSVESDVSLPSIRYNLQGQRVGSDFRGFVILSPAGCKFLER